MRSMPSRAANRPQRRGCSPAKSRSLRPLADLGCDHDLVALAAPLQPFADDRFGFAAAIARAPSANRCRPCRCSRGPLDECVEHRERAASSALQPNTLPPSTSGAIGIPDWPSLRFFIVAHSMRVSRRRGGAGEFQRAPAMQRRDMTAESGARWRRSQLPLDAMIRSAHRAASRRHSAWSSTTHRDDRCARACRARANG